MNELDLNNLSEQEIIEKYNDIIESGSQILIAKCTSVAPFYCSATECCTKASCGGYCVKTAQ